MKKSVLFKIAIILLTFVGFNSCEEFGLIGIKGSGPVVTDSIETSAVEGIKLEIPATVYLEKGEFQSIIIEAQQNIINNINYSNAGGVLKLQFDQMVAHAEPIVIRMTVKSLKEVTINGSGDIISETGFESDNDLKIEISGSGNIDLIAKAKSVNMFISGSGNINLVTECEEITGDINGSGDINLNAGNSMLASYYISGSGDINAYSFISQHCQLKTDGSGDSKLYVTQQLNVKINGSGDVYYKGNPSISASVNGSGDVIHVE